MQKLWRNRGLVALLALAIIAATGLIPTSNAQAAVGSGYGFIVDGEEMAVGSDPISVKSGLLLPQELLRNLGIIFRGSGTDGFVLTRGTLQVTVKVGDRVAVANGQKVSLAYAPLRANGQLYLPDGILAYLGVQVTTEGSMLLIERWPLVEPAGTADYWDYQAIMGTYSAKTHLDMSKTDALTATLIRLTPEIIREKLWAENPAVRGQAERLLKDNTLIDLEIYNQTSTFYQYPISNLLIVDDLGNQYNPTGSILPIQGDITQTFAPSAKARAVVVFPPLRSEAKSFKIYAKSNTYPLVNFNLGK